MGTNVAKAWVVLRTASATIIPCPVSLTAYLRRTRIKLKTRRHRQRRAVFKTHLLHILVKKFRLDCSSAAAWGVNGMSSSLGGGLPRSVGTRCPPLMKLFADHPGPVSSC